jgi:glycolate oxidase FAD binding subunit
MTDVRPGTPAELADALRTAHGAGRSILIEGAGSKRMMGGPSDAADTAVRITTAGLARVLEYDPRDLTVSVEAGLPWKQFSALLAERNQMVPLDPPFADQATVGGAVAANTSGPRRRLYGTARDQVIGMKFITVEGQVVESGGMVVKNVAGLDMQKILIGSFGTLAAISSVNFRVAPCPEAGATFVMEEPAAQAAAALRDRILSSVLQPAAIDLLNPAAAARTGGSGYLLAVRAGGTPRVLDRYRRELAGAARLEGEAETRFWNSVEEFVPRWMADHPDGAAVRVSHVLHALAEVLESAGGPCVARAGNGAAWLCFEDEAAVAAWMRSAAGRGWNRAVEYSGPAIKRTLDLWPDPGDDFDLMRRIKRTFDPQGLLNRGRLYGRI